MTGRSLGGSMTPKQAERIAGAMADLIRTATTYSRDDGTIGISNDTRHLVCALLAVPCDCNDTACRLARKTA